MELKQYNVTVNDRRATTTVLQLSDEDAKRAGLTEKDLWTPDGEAAKPAAAKKAAPKAPANKARAPRNKAAAKPAAAKTPAAAAVEDASDPDASE